MLKTLGGILFCLTFLAHGNEECNIFTSPEQCLGESPTVLSNVEYDVREHGRGTRYTVSPENNPLRLLIWVDAYNDAIYSVRYSYTTSRYSATLPEYNEFRDQMRLIRLSDSWLLRKSTTGTYDFFEDEMVKIALFNNSVVFYSKLHAPQAP